MEPARVIELRRTENDAPVRRARWWLLGIAAVCLVSGPVLFAQALKDNERWIKSEEAATPDMTSEERDAYHVVDGIPWGDAKRYAHLDAYLSLFANIGLAIAYVVAWFWARRNPLAATVAALLLFIAVIIGNAIYDPTTLGQGFIIRGLFIAALVKAVAQAYEERKLQAHMPRARLT